MGVLRCLGVGISRHRALLVERSNQPLEIRRRVRSASYAQLARLIARQRRFPYYEDGRLRPGLFLENQ